MVAKIDQPQTAFSLCKVVLQHIFNWRERFRQDVPTVIIREIYDIEEK